MFFFFFATVAWWSKSLGTDENPNLLFQIPDLSQDGSSVLDGLDQLAAVLQEI